MDYIDQKIEFYKSNYKKFKKKFYNFTDFVLTFSEPKKVEMKIEKKKKISNHFTFVI